MCSVPQVHIQPREQLWDAWQCLKVVEKDDRLKPINYLGRQPQITATFRLKIVDWILLHSFQPNKL
jgi:hypothetical protein